MASYKVYIKKGGRDRKERNMVRELEDFIDKKLEQDPSFLDNFKPANNLTELERLHNTYVVEDVDFEDIPEGKKGSHEEDEDEPAPSSSEAGKGVKEIIDDDNYSFVDPLNRQEPKVRSYVTDNEYPNDQSDVAQENTGNIDFGEPPTFNDAFTMPNGDVLGSSPENKTNAGSSTKGGNDSGGSTGGNSGQPKKEQPKPINPQFGEMNTSKQKRSARKFAKTIVEVACFVSEKGLAWYVTRLTNESKIAEYQITGEIDLSIILDMQGHEATVKEFFQTHNYNASELFKTEPEEKEELIDAMAEFFVFKGIAPTPEQEILIAWGGWALKKGILAFAMNANITAAVNQFKEVTENNGGARRRAAPSPVVAPEPPKQPAPQPTYEEPVYEAPPKRPPPTENHIVKEEMPDELSGVVPNAEEKYLQELRKMDALTDGAIDTEE
jgi:hypothetical protein